MRLPLILHIAVEYLVILSGMFLCLRSEERRVGKEC